MYFNKIWKVLLAILLISSQVNTYAQNTLLGNEWINNYNLNYYKIKVAEDGLFRLYASTLNQNGVDVNTIIPEQLQLFHNGKEVPIVVQVNSNNELDYLQFIGFKNRGELDKELYIYDKQQLNQEYSLYSDSSCYFLTWNTGINGLRYQDIIYNGNNFNNPVTHYRHKEKLVYNSYWNKGKLYSIANAKLSQSLYEQGEGFGSPFRSNHSIQVPISDLVQSGTSPTLDVRAYANGTRNHELELSASSTTLKSFNFWGDSVNTWSSNLSSSLLNNGNTTIQVKGKQHSSSNDDQYSISHLTLSYNRAFQFDNKGIFFFHMERDVNNRHLEIQNFNATNSSNQVYLYDLSTRQRTKCINISNSSIRTEILGNNSNDEHQLVMVNENDNLGYYKIINELEVTKFIDFTQNSYRFTNYIILYHNSLTKEANGGNPVEDYKQYRINNSNYIANSINIEQIYDQFGYGHRHHPLAIRKFTEFTELNWTNPNKYLFIIGKGRAYNATRGNSSYLLVPTFGYPESDNLLVFKRNYKYPMVAIGRLAAVSPDEVRLYLNKIKALELERSLAQPTIDGIAWTKKVLHLGGGRVSGEQNLIKANLNRMKDIIEQPQVGADVESFFKTSSSPIQVASSSNLKNLIDNGISILTFYGHSSANSFDFNLDHPSNYNNINRYPLVLAMGCYGGSIFDYTKNISEDFIFEPQAGASVFLASVGAATLNGLNEFATRFYSNLNGVNYSEGAARAVRQSFIDMYNSNLTSNGSVTFNMITQYLIYHGDPALKIHTAVQPDFYTDQSLVKHSPQTVNIQQNTFQLIIDIHNLGKAINDSLKIKVTHTFPDGTKEFYYPFIQAPFNMDSLVLDIPLSNTAKELGLNTFDIHVDSDSSFVEVSESNNFASYSIQIISDDVIPVFPYEFSIVPSQDITLYASKGNIISPYSQFVMEIDTNAYFTNPLAQTQITSSQSLLSWKPSLNYQDSTVYYWRVYPINTTPDSFMQHSSFIYINGEFPGWNQSHFFQFDKDKITNIDYTEQHRTFKYVTTQQEVRINTGNILNGSVNKEQVACYFNGNREDKVYTPSETGTYVITIDPQTLEFWELDQPKCGAINPSSIHGHNTIMWLFETDKPVANNALDRFLRDTIPDGHYVMLLTLNEAFAKNYDSSTVTFLKNEGALLIEAFQDSSINGVELPYAFFFKKGNGVDIATDTLGQNIYSVIQLSGLMSENWTEGNINSTIIGPAQQWGSFHWKNSQLDTFNTDISYVNIYGLDANKNNKTLIKQGIINPDNIFTSTDTIQNFPYLQLEWITKDPSTKTSAQLDYWRILYNEIPEAALKSYTLSNTQPQRGEPINLNILMENIGNVDMDKMLVKYGLVGTDMDTMRTSKLLLKGDTLQATLDIKAVRAGKQQLFVEINPDNDQLEQHHFNNIGLINIQIEEDRINPILDVTFDNVHIMNGDIVSAKPYIQITLDDENKYLPLNRFEDIQVIMRPAGVNSDTADILFTQNMTDYQIEFTPADSNGLSSKNQAQLSILPKNAIPNGRYTLFVSASDRSENNSGKYSYSIEFEVIQEETISNMLNYPNPFSNSTQFVFTITGSELPDELKIQILTVSGKVVKEIAMDELGPLHVGLNKTDYAWDGTDEFGDKLANGVYLYRIIARKNGSAYGKRYNNRVDYLFKKGFGKMYLMR